MNDQRQKVHEFMDLPYHVRRARVVDLGLFEDGDDYVRGDEIDILWAGRAKAKGCVEELLIGESSQAPQEKP